MTKREKRLQRMRQHSRDVTFNTLKVILEDFGFEHVQTAGSHHTFIAQQFGKDWRLTIPFNRPIK